MGGYVFLRFFTFPIRKELGVNVLSPLNYANSKHYQPITNRITTIIAQISPSIDGFWFRDITKSKLQGDDTLKDNEIAEIADYSAYAIRCIRLNLLRFRTTTILLNSASRSKTIDLPMLTALCN